MHGNRFVSNNRIKLVIKLAPKNRMSGRKSCYSHIVQYSTGLLRVYLQHVLIRDKFYDTRVYIQIISVSLKETIKINVV